MKKSLPLSSRLITSLLVVIAVVALGTIRGFMQQNPVFTNTEAVRAADTRLTPDASGDKKEEVSPSEPKVNPNAITATTYPFTFSSGASLEDMSSGTTALVAPFVFAGIDDDPSVVSNIGFEFWFNGVRYTQFSCNANGLARLGPTIISNAFTNSLTNATDDPKIAPYWDDISIGTNGKVHYKVVGSAPNRKLVVEWLNMNIPRAVGSAGAATFQMWLYETTGKIEYVYGSGIVAGTSYSVGFSDAAAVFASVTAGASPTVSYAAANNANTAAITSGTKYTFTPLIPVDPTALNFTNTTYTTTTLNWTDASSNELGFVIYRSDDGGTTYRFVGQAAANTVSSLQTGLAASTQYFWKVFAVTEGGLSANSASGMVTTAATGVGAIVSAGNGNWNSVTPNAPWPGGVVPTSADNVIIADGTTVTVNVTTAACASLQVGQGATGVLIYDSATASTLTVGGDVTVSSGGTLQSATTGTVTTHSLSVGGNLTNNGTLDLSTNTNTAGAVLTFTGLLNTTFSGTGGTTDLRTLTINKGNSSASTLEVTTTNFSVQGATTDSTSAAFATVTNGTLKISGTFTASFRTFVGAFGYTIPATAGFWLNNPNYTHIGGAGSPIISGLLRVSAGNYNIGSTNNSLTLSSGAVVTVEGGAINTTARLAVISAANSVNYNQSGGTVTLSTAAAGNTSTTLACFDMGQSGGSSVTISGGSIVHQNNGTGASGPRDYRNLAGLQTLTAGTVQFGNASSGVAKTYNLQGFVPNLTISNASANHTVQLQNLTVPVLTTTVNTGTTLSCNGFTFLQQGTTVTNNGAITGTVANSRFDFAGTAAQTYGGTGTFGTAGTPFAGVGVGVANTMNATLNAAIVTTRVNLFTGSFINSAQITIGNAGASTGFIQRGGSTPSPAGAFDVAPIFNVGTGGLTVSYFNGGTLTTTSNEIPAGRSLASITINSSPGVTLSGGGVSLTGILTMTAGTLATSSSNMPTITNTAAGGVVGGSATSYVNGPLARTLPASLVTGSTYTFPVGKAAFNMLELVNPTTTAGGTVVVKSEVFDADSGGTAGTGLDAISHTRYWNATMTSGAANFTNSSVRLTEIPPSGTKIGQSATQAGAYNSIGGTTVGNTVLSTTTTSLDYFALGFSTLAGGTYSVGGGGTYGTLTAACADINSKVLTGPVVLSLTDASYSASETFPLTINGNPGSSATNTITIRPASGVTSIIFGSNATTIFDLSGAKFVTIDGSNSGGLAPIKGNAPSSPSGDLTIRNTSTSGATIRFINDASNDTIKNAIIEGASTSTTNGVVFFSTGTTTGNINNTVTNNTIRDRSDAAGVPADLVYSNGTSAVITNKGNTISNNQLKNFTTNGVTTTTTGNENWTISGNAIFEEAARSTTLNAISFASLGTNTITQNTIRDINTSGSATGINISDARATTISRNQLYNFPSTSGSTGTLTGINFTGSSTNPSSITLVNNMISIIPSFNNSQTIYGIRDFAFSGNTINTYFNSVLIGGTATGSTTWAYNRGGSTPTTSALSDNILLNNRTGGAVNHFAAGDGSANTGSWSSNFNIFVGTGTTAANFMDYGSSSSGTPVSFAAWQTGPPARDANSQASNPGGNYTPANLFISNTDLHLSVAGTNPALSAGNSTGTGVTTDFDADPRPASNQDIGADELVQSAAGTIPAGTFYNAQTADGDSLAGNVSITNVIYLIGKLSTGASTLSIGCNATVSGGGALNYVIGNLKKTYCATGSKSFEVGTANGFSPVTVNITAGTFPADFTTKAVQGAQPNLAVPAKALSRYWTLSATGVTADLTFNYLDPLDIPMTANEAAFVIFKYNGSFSMPGGTVNPGSDNATITGVTSFSDWTLAEPSAEPCPLSTTPTSQNFPGAGGSNSFTVTADGGCVWTPVSNNAFITIDTVSKPTGGHAGNGTVNYSVAPNLGVARMGTITIGVLTFTVTQDTGCSYMLGASSHNFNAPGGSSTVGVTATTGCAWTAVSNDAFIIIDSGTPGSGNGTVNYHVTANSGPARMGTMTIAGFTFNVTQDAACAYMLSATSAHFTNAGGTDSVNVLTGTGCTWTAMSNDAFIMITMGASGSGNGTVNYSVAANMGPARMGTMTIAGITFTVSQDGGCTFSLSREHQSFPGNGGSASVNVTASDSTCPWTASTAATYIHFTSGTPGTGNGTLMYTVDANPGPSIRSATITIAGHTYTVYQGIDFLDVPSNHLFYTDIGKLAARGVTLGCGSGNYCPNDSVLREQMAAFILRAKGEFNPPMPASQRFTDVPPANVFYNFIDRLAVLGITLGCNPPTNDMYCPGSAVTREQMSAFILRGLGEFSPPTPGSQRFNDVPPANVFYNFIDRMAVLNITLGCTPDHLFYCPSDPVTRAQMAAFLVRAYDL